MKADISDAPERITRRRHKHSVVYTVTCLVIGSIATIGALPLISGTPGLDLAHKQTTSPAGSDEGFARASNMLPMQGVESPQHRALPDTPVAANTARQTVFDDRNFIPRGADNVVSLRVGAELASKDEAPKQAKLTIVRQSLSMKDRVCWPYRQGSIESRNCRASVGLKHRD